MRLRARATRTVIKFVTVGFQARDKFFEIGDRKIVLCNYDHWCSCHTDDWLEVPPRIIRKTCVHSDRSGVCAECTDDDGVPIPDRLCHASRADGCVYRKPRLEHIGDEVRQESGMN